MDNWWCTIERSATAPYARKFEDEPTREVPITDRASLRTPYWFPNPASALVLRAWGTQAGSRCTWAHNLQCASRTWDDCSRQAACI